MLKNKIEKCRMRRQFPISKAQLARKLGVHRSHITLLEQGLRQPSTKLLFRMSKVLGCPVTEIYEYLPSDQKPQD